MAVMLCPDLREAISKTDEPPQGGHFVARNAEIAKELIQPLPVLCVLCG
jgi:hypothetical protein